MNMDEKRFIDELTRASIFYISKTEEISKFTEDGMYTSEHDIYIVYDNGMVFLTNRSNYACLFKNTYGVLGEKIRQC